MKPFRIATVNDELTHVPFELPIKGRKPLQFSLPRLNFMSEQQAKSVREKLLELDAPVPLVDPVTGDAVIEVDAQGREVYVDSEGKKVDRNDDGSLPDVDGIKPKQLEGPKPRTPMDRTRATALAMLTSLVSEPVAKVLESLTAGELEQIVDHWTEVSGTKIDRADDPEVTDLGESSASSTS